MLRGAVGVGLFAVGLLVLGQSARHASWEVVAAEAGPLVDQRIEAGHDAGGHPDVRVVNVRADGRRLGDVVYRYFGAVDEERLAYANLIALAALLVMCWPARKASRRSAAGDARDVKVQQNFGNVTRPDAAPAPAAAPDLDPADLKPHQA